MDDSDYLRLLTIAAEQANAFLSNARKWERERWVCQRLLQGLNIPYRADEFAPAGEPPDVLFREANFEVFFVLDEGRRLNDEWRDELQRRRSAFSLSQLVRREAKPKRIPANEFLLRLAPTLRKKAHNYKERGMDLGELDIIAFASLKREVLDLNSHFPPLTEYLRQGWRSLSLVGPTFARVLFAHPEAPDFLRNNLGRSIVFDVGISLVSPLQELIAQVPQTGRVRWIGVRPQSRSPMIALDAVEARFEAGLTGDHARPGARNARQVTLIQWEHLAAISSLMGRPDDQPVLPQDLRRNLVVSGINLFSLKGRRFKIGQAILKPLVGASPARALNTTSAPGPFRPCAAMAESPSECYKVASFDWTTR